MWWLYVMTCACWQGGTASRAVARTPGRDGINRRPRLTGGGEPGHNLLQYKGKQGHAYMRGKGPLQRQPAAARHCLSHRQGDMFDCTARVACVSACQGQACVTTVGDVMEPAPSAAGFSRG